MELDLRTEKEKERDERYDLIVKLYNKLTSKNPQYKPNRYINAIALEVEMSPLAVRQVLQRKGVI